MAKFLIAWADGIGTQKLDPEDVRSVLIDVVRRLETGLRGHGHEVASAKVMWKASMAGIGGPTSWDDAAAEGLVLLDEIIRLRATGDTKIILLGYSGGCKVIHDWIDTQPHTVREGRIAAVGLLSDPFRPSAAYQADTPDPGGYGICGSRVGIPGRTFWTSFHADVISSCPADSPLRTLADLSDKIPGSFLEDFSQHMRLGNWQLANYIKLWKRDPLAYLRNLPRRMDEARRGVEGYLGSAHTLAYTREFATYDKPTDRRPLTFRLADSIAWKVR